MLFFALYDFSYCIDVSCDYMSIESHIGSYASFYIEGVSRFFGREIRNPETLFHHEKLIKIILDPSESHTGSIVSDTLTEPELCFWEAIFYTKKSSFSRDDFRLFFDNSGKHEYYFL